MRNYRSTYLCSQLFNALAVDAARLLSHFLNHLPSYSQDAQLSQKDRAMLSVIEYFAKSLKVIWNNTLEKGVGPC